MTDKLQVYRQDGNTHHLIKLIQFTSGVSFSRLKCCKYQNELGAVNVKPGKKNTRRINVAGACERMLRYCIPKSWPEAANVLEIIPIIRG